MEPNDKENLKRIDKWSESVVDWISRCAKQINDIVRDNKNTETKVTQLENTIKKLRHDSINTHRMYNNTLKRIKELESENIRIRQDVDNNNRILQGIIKGQ